MTQQANDPAKYFGNDVSDLFSNFGAFSPSVRYRELVRDEAAYQAVCRWPLLAELQGMDESESSDIPRS